MKKKLALMLALVLMSTMFVVGCGEDDVDRIIIFQSKVEIIDQLEQLAIEYYEETGIRVEIHGTPGDDYFQHLRMQLTTDQGPTVFNLAPGAEVESLAPYLADIGSLSFLGDMLNDGIIQRIDGRVVGIPYGFEGFGFVYNRSLYEPGDFASVDSLIAKMHRLDGGAVGLSSESHFLIVHILNAPFALQDNPEAFMEAVIAGEQDIVDLPEFQDFARLYEAIRSYSYNPLEMEYDRQMGGLAGGTIASVHQGNWSWGMLVDFDMDFEVGMAPVPLLGNQSLSVDIPSVWAVNSQKDEAEIQAGIDFLEWLYTSETGQRFLYDEFGFIPVLRGVETDLDPLSAEVQRFVGEGRTIEWATNFFPAGIHETHLVPIAQEFFTTDMSGAELLEAIQTAFREAGN